MLPCLCLSLNVVCFFFFGAVILSWLLLSLTGFLVPLLPKRQGNQHTTNHNCRLWKISHTNKQTLTHSQVTYANLNQLKAEKKKLPKIPVEILLDLLVEVAIENDPLKLTTQIKLAVASAAMFLVQFLPNSGNDNNVKVATEIIPI